MPEPDRNPRPHLTLALAPALTPTQANSALSEASSTGWRVANQTRVLKCARPPPSRPRSSDLPVAPPTRALQTSVHLGDPPSTKLQGRKGHCDARATPTGSRESRFVCSAHISHIDLFHLIKSHSFFDTSHKPHSEFAHGHGHSLVQHRTCHASRHTCDL